MDRRAQGGLLLAANRRPNPKARVKPRQRSPLGDFVHTHPVGVGVAAFLVGGAIGATVGGTLVGRMAKEEIRKASSALPIKVQRYANVPKAQQYTPKLPNAQQFLSSSRSDTRVTAGGPGQPAQNQSQPSLFAKNVSHLYTL